MLRYLTAGESHGRALVATLDGIPAHVKVSSDDVRDALARRRLGAGRGARMSFEADEVTLLGGFRHGETLGSPIAIMVGNSEWPKWEQVMSPDEVDAGADSVVLGAAEVDVAVVAEVEVEVSLPAAVTGAGASARSSTVSIT